jgi:CheY-like chemotaxis protein
MAERTGVRIERRRHVRIAPKGNVVLLAGELAQRGRIVNLSQGGLLMQTEVMPPDRWLHEAVEIELRLDGQLDQWLRASGRVSRLDAAANAIAVAFETIPMPLVHLIDEMSAASHTRLRVLSVILIDADPLRRPAMAEGFRSAGCTVLEIATPLEAIVRLGESSFEPDLIAIADSLPDTVANELRSFVERAHPRVKLVAIGDDLAKPAGISHWLSSADPASDLITRVRHVLGDPRSP